MHVVKKESKAEILMGSISFVLFLYLLIGTPVWMSLAEGKPIFPGLLYEPAVRLIQAVLG
ncbi:MAG: hypothetical protein K9M10_00340 [Candidatus Pacebacteria bacterium]|nr:hypothetical protein [Candidatus Paceibacterota bacterium]MCF7856911.1 hypothetical protein [Candidatus Paceibacterota bacterium]